METDKPFQSAVLQLPGWFQTIAEKLPPEEQKQISEIRLWANQPIVWMKRGQCFFCSDRRLTDHPTGKERVLTKQELMDCFYSICHDSVHTVQQELCQGFVSLPGGHRAGICGTAVHHQGEQTGLRDISSINLRIARSIPGCAQELYQKLFSGGRALNGLLIAGAPASGKTTVLRDLVRILCSGKETRCHIVAVVDEREELSGGHDLGITSHVLRKIPKERAIQQALRTLAPEYIVCDEIGTKEEAQLLSQGLNAGTGFIGTIHAGSWQELLRRPSFRALLEQQALDAVVLLSDRSQPGKIDRIIKLQEVQRNDACCGLCPDFSVGDDDRMEQTGKNGAEAQGVGGVSAFSAIYSGGTLPNALQQ